MKSMMQTILGPDWTQLPPVLQAHYRFGTTVENGRMTIDYPKFMQPFLSVLRIFGALINRRGQLIPTRVEKSVVAEHQYWRRTITFPDGKVVHFNSFWVSTADNQLIEFVNPMLGLQMAPEVLNGQLHYRGIRFVLKIGSLLLPIPEWLALGHTSIVEVALDETHFAMDFQMKHPLFGQLFRYSGEFEVMPSSASSTQNPTHL